MTLQSKCLLCGHPVIQGWYILGTKEGEEDRTFCSQKHRKKWKKENNYE